MPAIPPNQTAYDTVNTVLNAARVRVQDTVKTLYPVSGNILDNTQSFTQQCSNNGYRRLQDILENLGFSRFEDTQIITAFPALDASVQTDPASQAYINWFNSFDGVNTVDQPILPEQMIEPLWVKERLTGSNGYFQPLEKMLDGLPGWQKQTFNRLWMWQQDTLYLAGATSAVDLQIKFISYLPDFIDIGPTRWYQQPVPIKRSSTALSCLIAAEFLVDNPAAALRLTTMGQDAAKLIMNRDAKANQRVNARRRSRSGRLEGQGMGYGGWC